MTKTSAAVTAFCAAITFQRGSDPSPENERSSAFGYLAGVAFVLATLGGAAATENFTVGDVVSVVTGKTPANTPVDTISPVLR